MAEERIYRILIGGGGTGGHVFPAIAIADAIREKHPQAEFLFVGAQGRLEMEKVPEAGYKVVGLPVSGFQRRVTLKNITFFFKLAASMIRSRRIVQKFAPHAAVGVGGYASGPILKAAARKGIPILLQEQNSYAGVTNRLLARSAQVICVAYEKMERYFPAEKIILTGNPVRQQLGGVPRDRSRDLDEFRLEKGKKVCLVVGGSLGAGTLNGALAKGLEKLDRKDLQVLWQCGRLYHGEVEGQVVASGLKNIRVVPFISRMDYAYGAADVIISRAGAITISELCLIGKPAILVPSPNVAEDHQTRNAEALVMRGAAVMVPDREAEERLVDAMLELAADESRQRQLSENIKKLGIPDASSRIASEVIKLIETP
jgi:UDP-N-acetylglucosamine--N-acetylmuramyl-(pentapeptide) pyrophosphoryl-undecaprenol N-acetylglucosamine transferase